MGNLEKDTLTGEDTGYTYTSIFTILYYKKKKYIYNRV